MENLKEMVDVNKIVGDAVETRTGRDYPYLQGFFQFRRRGNSLSIRRKETATTAPPYRAPLRRR